MNVISFKPDVRIPLLAISFVLLSVHPTLSAFQQHRHVASYIESCLNNGNWREVELPSDWPKDADRVAALKYGATDLETREAKIACLKLLAERFPFSALEAFTEIAKLDMQDPEIRKLAIQCCALYRAPELEGMFLRLVENDDQQIRIAAIDGLGMLAMPAHYGRRRYAKTSRKHFIGPPPIQASLQCSPQIDVLSITSIGNSIWRKVADGKSEIDVGNRVGTFEQPLMRRSNSPRSIHWHPKPKKIGDATVLRLRKIMLEGRTHEDREAAARAIVVMPPTDYQLRYAEWGVWLSNDGEMMIPQSIVDELPRFVHRTQNPIEELAKRVQRIIIIDKPVIHLTTDKPLSVDIEATIRSGQPWFGFPRPNDFYVMAGGSHSDKSLNDKDFQKALTLVSKNAVKKPNERVLAKRRTGYPWLDPPQRRFGQMAGSTASKNNVLGIGLVWESVIVSPKKLAWMKPPNVSGKRHQWWSELREVESSWISANGESDRFLYYDGPTILPSPSRVEIGVNELEIDFPRQIYHRTEGFTEPVHCLFITTSQAGKLKGQKIVIEKTAESIRTPITLELDGEQVESALLNLVQINGGLTSTEANGLIIAWRKQFLETPGERLLVRLNKNHYDYACPLKIRPIPTECARVGLVLHELSFADE